MSIINEGIITPVEYSPAKSKGGFYALATLTLMSVFLFSIMIILFYVTRNLIFLIFFLSLTIFMVALFAYISYQFFSLKYILSENELQIKCGVRTTKFGYDSIQKIGKTQSSHIDGLRVFGTAIPGFVQGKFNLLLDGKFENVVMFATKLANLIIFSIKGEKKAKFIGITPENPEKFLEVIKNKSARMEISEFDTSKKLETPREEKTKYEEYTRILFFTTFVFIAITIITFIIYYIQLPAIIPLHFNLVFQPDVYGPKSLLILELILLDGIGFGFNILLHHWIMNKSELAKTSNGYKIMLLPLIIIISFLIINIAVFQLILQNLIPSL